VSVASWPGYDEAKIIPRFTSRRRLSAILLMTITSVLKLISIVKPKTIKLYLAEHGNSGCLSFFEKGLKQTREQKSLLAQVMNDEEIKKARPGSCQDNPGNN